MSFVEQSLIPEEKIIFKARLHWRIFVVPASLLFFVCILFAFSFADETQIMAIILILPLLAILMRVVHLLIVYVTTEFAVTNRRIIVKNGFIRRHALELWLTQVESIRVDQPLVGRVLNYGTVLITGNGGTKEKFPDIARPMELRKHVNALLAG